MSLTSDLMIPPPWAYGEMNAWVTDRGNRGITDTIPPAQPMGETANSPPMRPMDDPFTVANPYLHQLDHRVKTQDRMVLPFDWNSVAAPDTRKINPPVPASDAQAQTLGLQIYPRPGNPALYGPGPSDPRMYPIPPDFSLFSDEAVEVPVNERVVNEFFEPVVEPQFLDIDFSKPIATFGGAILVLAGVWVLLGRPGESIARAAIDRRI